MNALREKILKLFKNTPKMEKMGFLSSFFKTTPDDFTDSELVDIDIVREGEFVAPVLTDVSNGATIVSNDIFTGKQVRPPIYSLANPVGLWDLLNRQPGETEYENSGNWFGRLCARLKRGLVLEYGMIKRSIELQAAQVLQDGTVSITDEHGNEAFTLDYKMKASHKKTVSTKWDQTGANPLADLEDMCDSVREDGLVDASMAIFGKKAWNSFIKNADVQNAVKKDALGLGNLSPRLMDKGGKYMGYIELGAYRVDLFTYGGRYTPFGTTSSNTYIDPKKVIVTASEEDLDFRLVYGGVPSLPMQEPFASVVPEEVTYGDSVRFNNRVYTDIPKNKHFAEATSRPLCVPVSIDRFGCMTVLS